MALGGDRPDGVGRAESKRGQAERQEDAKRAEEGDDLENDDQEFGAVAGEADLGLPDSRARFNRFERDVVAGFEKGERRGGGCREPVRQQVNEFTELRASRATKT